MHIHQKRLFFMIFCMVLPYCLLCQAQNINIRTGCPSLPKVQSVELMSLIQRLKNSEIAIGEAYDSMKHFYQNAGIPLECTFTITCAECDGMSYMYYPVKVARDRGDRYAGIFGDRSGKYGNLDVEKLYGNELHILNEASVDISPIHKVQPGSDEQFFIEYAYGGETYSKPLRTNSKQQIIISWASLYDDIKEHDVGQLDNKIYYLSGGKKKYLSPRTFRLCFYSAEERENLKRAVLDYKELYPTTSDEGVVKNFHEMLNMKYGALLYNDLENWYKGIK